MVFIARAGIVFEDGLTGMASNSTRLAVANGDALVEQQRLGLFECLVGS